MILKRLKEVVKAVIGKTLHQEKLIEMADWLHHLEFLVIKVMMFTIGVHHLYVYTMKTVFWAETSSLQFTSSPGLASHNKNRTTTRTELFATKRIVFGSKLGRTWWGVAMISLTLGGKLPVHNPIRTIRNKEIDSYPQAKKSHMPKIEYPMT